ncbi:MAG TPA: PEP-CTERM sorting domain-containing protein [Gemmataceae bacterium]|nr:PEP-CTERM sorting domain-containing protein [Gemmataceae bacterium]
MIRIREWRLGGITLRLMAVLTALYFAQASASASLITLTGVHTLDFDHSSGQTVPQYLNSVLGGVASISGYYAWGNGYAGEGYVVGKTLADGVGDYLRTDQSGDGRAFTITFSQPIYGISFAFEIFPDANAPTSSVPMSQWPDFTFNAYSGSDLVEHFYTQGQIPSGSSANNTHETAPQLLSSASFTFPNGVTRLDFIDWPPTIGIDDVSLNFDPPSSVPEPATFVLFATMLGGLGVCLRKRGRCPVPWD